VPHPRADIPVAVASVDVEVAEDSEVVTVVDVTVMVVDSVVDVVAEDSVVMVEAAADKVEQVPVTPVLETGPVRFLAATTQTSPGVTPATNARNLSPSVCLAEEVAAAAVVVVDSVVAVVVAVAAVEASVAVTVEVVVEDLATGAVEAEVELCVVADTGVEGATGMDLDIDRINRKPVSLPLSHPFPPLAITLESFFILVYHTNSSPVTSLTSCYMKGVSILRDCSV